MRGFRQWRWHLDEMYAKLTGEMDYRKRCFQATAIQSMSSPTRLAGWPLASLVSVSVRYPCGLMALSLQHSMSVAITT